MRATLAALALLNLAPVAAAADWPQWRGPSRDGTTGEKSWLAGWPAGKAPRVAWRAKVGKGHSGVVVAGGLALTVGWDGKEDTLFCFDAKTGKEKWRKSEPCKGIKQWPGPRATPTVHDGAVYTLGQHGRLRARAVRDGLSLWEKQLSASYNPDVDYGFAWSPLVEGDLLILSAGKRGLAVGRKDGAFAWGNDGQHGACASPVPFELGGKRGVAVLTTDKGRESVSLVGVEPKTGKELWRGGPWREKWGAACSDLVVADGKVFITTSEQYPRCARYSIRGGALKLDWESTKLNSYTGSCVLVGGHLYGVSRGGLLRCLDWKTGAEKWSRRGFGQFGALIAADGKLIVQTSETGEVVVAEASAAGYKELRRAKVFRGEAVTFTAPSLAGGRLYCRSYAGEVVCLDLTGKP
jgi:outer membrane protein assembly factor BamB